MSGRRLGAVGVRRQARAAAGPLAATIESAAGDSLVNYYEHFARTLGTGPDLAILTNLQGDALMNQDQSSEPARPHWTEGQIDFDGAAGQHVDVTGLATAPYVNGDLATLFAVAELDSTTAESLFEFSLNGTATNNGFALFANGGLMFARCLAVSTLITATKAVSTGVRQVYRASIRTDEIAVAINGVEEVSPQVGNGGIRNSLPQIQIGTAADGGSSLDGRGYTWVALVNPTAQQETDVENILIAGLP